MYIGNVKGGLYKIALGNQKYVTLVSKLPSYLLVLVDKREAPELPALSAAMSAFTPSPVYLFQPSICISTRAAYSPFSANNVESRQVAKALMYRKFRQFLLFTSFNNK
jgi:hypothetical protein